MNKYSYLLIRLGIGISMFGHGLVRLPKLQGFSSWMMKSFEKSMLPAPFVEAFSYLLPFAEFLTGLLLLIGLFTRQALLAGGSIMLVLLFGTAMIENWEAIPSQLLHLVIFAVLLHFAESNSYAVDKIKGRSI